MPYLQGETIRDKLDRETQFGIDEAVKIATEVADALDYAHQNGVIHRDIKPENILLHNNRPMVMDFGIALAVSAAAGGRMTETGLSLGTPHYMSPEQATADKDITARSDLYSLASVLYEMLAGDPPHTASAAQTVIMKIVTEEAAPVTTRRKSVPPNVAAALARALEKLPADRFDSAKAFATALADRGFRTESSGAGEGAGLAGDRRLLYAAIAVGLVASVAAVIGWARQGEAPARPLAVEISLPSAAARSSDLAAAVAIAPHGDAFVYADTTGGIQQLWIKERGAVEPRILPGTVGASAPTLSPDGTQVAYFVDGRLMRLPLAGGAATAIADSFSFPSQFGSLPGAWLDDGSMVLTTFGQVFLVPPEGGSSTRLTTMDSLGIPILQVSPVPGKRAALIAGCQAFGCATPQVFLVRLDPLAIVPLVQGAPTAWALEGGRIVYVLGDGARYVAALDVDRATLGPSTQLPGRVTMGQLGASLIMSRDGTMLYVTGGAPPTSRQVELVLVGRDHPPTVVPGTTGLEIDNQSRIDVSPDGRSLLLSMSTGGSATQSYQGTYVLIRALETGASTRFTADGAANIRSSWSPDGRRILWISNRRNGRFEAWAQLADGTGEPELLASESREIYDAVFSPDGQWLIYRTDDVAPGAGDIYARRLSGDTTVVPIAVTAAEETSPDVSPDGKWIAYSEQIGDVKEVVVRSFPDASRSRIQVSFGSGLEPRWAPDGRTLIYRTYDDRFVFATVTTEGAFRVVSETSLSLGSDRFLSNEDTHQWDLMPNGRDLLLARLAGGDTAATTPLRVILEEQTIPAVGGRR
jgi:serine/threonine-protein kinase